jgi:hypothetical protein
MRNERYSVRRTFMYIVFIDVNWRVAEPLCQKYVQYMLQVREHV